MFFFVTHRMRLNSVAKQILAVIGESKIVLFKGEMGAGKTTLIKALCKLT